MGRGSICAILFGLVSLPILFSDCGGGGGGGSASLIPSGGRDNKIPGGGSGSDDYGAEQFEVCRGPFGGDRSSVVVHPLNPAYAITDSCDESGIWLTENAGKSWRRCNPPGAPFSKENTLVALLPKQGAEPDEVLVAIATDHDADASFYKIMLDDPDGVPAVPLLGVKSRVRCLATDQSPARPGRIAAAAYSASHLGEMIQGNIVFSPDRGRTWRRWFAGGRFHVVLSLAFAHGSERLLIGSGGSIDPADLERLYEDRGAAGIMALVYQLEHGMPVDAEWVSLYGIDEMPCVLVVDPDDGSLTGPGQVLNGRRIEAMALDPRVAGVIWFGHVEGLDRSPDDAQSTESVDMVVESMRVAFPKPIKPQGITVLEDPDTGKEIVLLALGGGWSRARGLFRLEYSHIDSTWFVNRVSAGADRTFLDYPKSAVVAAPTPSRLLYAPYCTEGMVVSHDFGRAGSWGIANEGLTGCNVFHVSEAPLDGSKIFCTGQNVIRCSTSRVADGCWQSIQVQIDQATANLRAGVTVDPGNADRWFVAGGAGSSGNLNGGIWLTEDGGQNWERILGSDSAPETNPQVYALVQHSAQPDLVVAASSLWMERGAPGIWASAARGAAGTYVRVLDDGSYVAAAAVSAGGAPAVLAGGEAGLALISVAGESPQAVKLPWHHGAVAALAADEEYAYAGTQEGDLFRVPIEFLDDEPLWTLITNVGGEITALACSLRRPGEVFLGLNENGILRSTDYGGAFADFDDGLESSERRIFHLLISSLGDRLYAGTLGGLAVRRLD